MPDPMLTMLSACKNAIERAQNELAESVVAVGSESQTAHATRAIGHALVAIAGALVAQLASVRE